MLSLFLHIFVNTNQRPTENTAKNLKYHFSYSKQNGNSIKLLNIITSSQCHNACNVFANKNVNVMISPDRIAILVLSDKQIRARFKYFQIKTHVKTVRNSHELNMDFRLFDNDFKQLCITNFMQECIFY